MDKNVNEKLIRKANNSEKKKIFTKNQAPTPPTTGVIF